MVTSEVSHDGQYLSLLGLSRCSSVLETMAIVPLNLLVYHHPVMMGIFKGLNSMWIAGMQKQQVSEEE